MCAKSIISSVLKHEAKVCPAYAQLSPLLASFLASKGTQSLRFKLSPDDVGRDSASVSFHSTFETFYRNG